MTQRIAQYNEEVGQPRGGLVSPKLLTMPQLNDELGALDHECENVRARVVELAVHYLSRLTNVLVESQEARQAVESIFRASLVSARRLSEAGLIPEAHRNATQALQGFTLSTDEDGIAPFELNEYAVQSACRLATYELARHAGVAWYDPADTGCSPDATTVSHIIMMTERMQDFLREHGPALAVEFSFVSEHDDAENDDEHGYSITLDGSDGDFITEQAVWVYMDQDSPPSNHHLLKLLVHYLMGKQSGLPQFATQTHVAVCNPRLNAVYRLAVNEIPDDVIETVRRDVIGSGMIEP